MALSVNPTLPVIAAQSATAATGGPVLLPGTVVDAAVLKAAESLVQIAIANLAMDVLTEVPLTAGQTLQLAVSQTQDGGVRLTIVGQGLGEAAGTGTAGATADYVNLSSAAQVNATSLILPGATTFDDPLTPLQRMAVEMESETAATRQQSLSPLFANLAAAAVSSNLPPALQEAMTRVLAQQASLEPGLSGDDIQAAFQKSGLFLEALLAAPQAPAEAGGVPDLKAALIVLRQALVSVVEAEGPASAPAAAASTQAGPTKYTANTTASPPLAPWPTPEADGAPHGGSLPPQLASPQGLFQGAAAGNPQGLFSEALQGLEPGSATAATVLNLLQESLQEIPRAGGNAQTTIILPDGRAEDVTLRTLTPPPPIRGALPSAQPVAGSAIPPGAPLATVARRLLEDTDAALARQTLLQVASLPQSADAHESRAEAAMSRWNFEIPFATQQGTAMAQFEISRDGSSNNEVEAPKRVWRARFTLDVEPAGPVHALVTYSGQRTSVRMWAERPYTAARLRAGAFELSQALSRAELVPGDIIIREGTPPQPAPAKAGYFLDRAL
ncbi:flagellar hook-length control protein FliK [Bradyrhizobium sp. Tv2a-2]|uniref:flagellar hook-length control protein FliK n=1 Tax=Bradyrhizobium sp. Tv2a-2 TaxID=113395 RepID=UPI000403FD8A|nr:flagellar hook-length control protein FliK [Bradyrhizobium sp. Tv2a-2]